MSVVAESCQEQKIHSHTTHPCIPYSTTSLFIFTLLPIPTYISGMILWTILLHLTEQQRPLNFNNSIHQSKLLIRKGANPLHITQGNIVPVLLQDNVPGANTKCWGRSCMRFSPCEPQAWKQHSCRWAPQRDMHQSAAAWTWCSALSFGYQRKEMVSVLLCECERQMQDTGSKCLSAVHCTDAEQA